MDPAQEQAEESEKTAVTLAILQWRGESRFLLKKILQKYTVPSILCSVDRWKRDSQVGRLLVSISHPCRAEAFNVGSP